MTELTLHPIKYILKYQKGMCEICGIFYPLLFRSANRKIGKEYIVNFKINTNKIFTKTA